MDNIIYKSTWGSINRTWGSLESHQWKDFALVIFNLEAEFQSKGIAQQIGESNFLQDTFKGSKGVKVDILDKRILFSEETEMSVAIFVSVVNFYEFLIYQLPWYDKINRTFQNVCRVLDICFRYLEEQIGRVERNLDLNTAIEMLGSFERDLGLKTNVDLSYRQRRNQIQAVLNSMFEQITEEAVKNIIKAFSNNDAGVEIFRTDEIDVFEIRFISNGLPNNMEELERVLRRVFPAHLDWKYSYTQNPWEYVTDNRLKWGDVESYSWGSINEYKGG